MRIDAAVEWREVAPQHHANQVLAADGAAGDAHQRGEQIEFNRCQIDWNTLPAHGAGSSVDLDISESNSGGGRMRRRPSQNRSNPRRQFGGFEGLRQVIVGPHFQTADTVERIASSRQHQDRGARPLADAAQDVEAVGVRQHHIEHDERVGLRECPFHAGGAVCLPTGLESFAHQEAADQPAEFGVVVNHQHTFHGSEG